MNKYNNPRLTNTTIAGSGMKHPVRPHVILGNPENGYIQGDIMDANAVVGAVNTQLNEMFDGAPEAFDTIGELVLTVKDASESIEKIDSIADTQTGPKYHLFDYLFTDGTVNQELVDGKTVVAICVGEASLFLDNKARFMAIKFPDSTGAATNDWSHTVVHKFISSTAMSYSFLKNLKDSEIVEETYVTTENVHTIINGKLVTDALYNYIIQKYEVSAAGVIDYLPAIALAKNFDDGYMAGEWYLPAAGELQICFDLDWSLLLDKIRMAGGMSLGSSNACWSSTIYNITANSLYDYTILPYEKSLAMSFPAYTTGVNVLSVTPFLLLSDPGNSIQPIVDYCETDSNSVRYIKNKPFIKNGKTWETGNNVKLNNGVFSVVSALKTAEMKGTGVSVKDNTSTNYATLTDGGVVVGTKDTSYILNAAGSTIRKDELLTPSLVADVHTLDASGDTVAIPTYNYPNGVFNVTISGAETRINLLNTSNKSIFAVINLITASGIPSIMGLHYQPAGGYLLELNKKYHIILRYDGTAKEWYMLDCKEYESVSQS